MRLSNTQNQRRDQFFRRKKTNRPMMLFAVAVKGHKGWCPLHVKIGRQWLSIEKHTERHNVSIYEFRHLGIGIRNRIHLLTANSARVKEIEQYGLVL